MLSPWLGDAGTNENPGFLPGSLDTIAPTIAITGAPATKGGDIPTSLGSTATDNVSTHFWYAWTVTKNGNAYASHQGEDAAGSSFNFTPNDNATYVVTLNVTDQAGNTSETNQTITVTNVAPTASITNPVTTSPEGTSITLDTAVTDPSTVDTAAGFSYLWHVTDSNGQTITDGTGGTSPSRRTITAVTAVR